MKPLYTAADSVFSVRPTTKQRGLVIALSLAASFVGSSALAQSANMPNPKSDNPGEVAKRKIQKKKDPVVKLQQFRQQRAASLVGSPAPAQTANTPFAKFEKLREKGLSVNIPGPADTVDRDIGGVRSALAEAGIGYIGWTQNTYTNNLLPDAAKSTIAKQLYNGQNPTYSTVNYMMMVYDLSRYGIPDGQIVIGTEHQAWSWQPGGPDRWGINEIAYYQTLFDRKVELKFGYLRNANEFLGPTVGGNAGANVFGPSSNILYQGGESSNATPTPAVNVKYNFDRNLYTKATIQRSISPDGVATEVTQNPTGLDWSTPNTGVLFMDETGYQAKAAPGSFETWVRAGVGVNNSRYTNLALPKQPRANENNFYYVAGDRQLWQSDPQGLVSRGFYGGFSVMGAPPDLNKVAQYYELRFYVKGPFDWRPTDQISLVATRTVWSNIAVQSALAAGNLVHSDSKAISATYSAHLAPGVYANIGLSYIDHPTSITYLPQTGHALNFSASTSIFF
ncbi:porin [Bradyrhizobium sp. i1.3.6]